MTGARAGRLGIGIVGAGRVGSVLALALAGPVVRARVHPAARVALVVDTTASMIAASIACSRRGTPPVRAAINRPLSSSTITD